MEIRPGVSTKIVIEIDPIRDKIRVGGSTVYDVQGSAIILAQIEPPITKSMAHKQVVVTYLSREKGDLIRYGFAAEVIEVIDYAITSGEQVKAVVVNRTGDCKPYSIRMFYRVGPTARSRLNMSVFNTRVNLLDISLGGVRFSYTKPLVLESDSIIDTRLEIDGRFHSVEAHVLRVWTGEGQGFDRRLSFASAEFVDLDKTMEHALSRKIHDIERESLAANQSLK